MAMNGNDGQAGRRPKRWAWVGVRLLVFALLGITTADCSFTWVTRPVPREEAPQYTALPLCTNSYWMPGLDTAAVALFSAAITNVSLNTSSGTIRSYTLAADGALVLTALASAIYGYYYVAECRQQESDSPDSPTIFCSATAGWRASRDPLEQWPGARSVPRVEPVPVQ